MRNKNGRGTELWLIHKNIEDGLKIKTLIPQIAEEYKQGEIVENLAKKFRNILMEANIFGSISTDGLKMALGYALGGYDGKFHDDQSYSYHGLMAHEEYLAIRNEHWKIRSRQTVLKAGNTPFESEEVILLKELIKDTVYRKDLSNVARVINETFHQGENIRTRKTLSTFLSKDKAKARKRELQLQEA